MADICDYFNDDGTATPDRVSELQNDWFNGEVDVTQDELSEAVNEWFQTDTYDACIQDTSEVVISEPTISVNNGTITAEYTVQNNILTGSGQTRAIQVDTTANGTLVDTTTFTDLQPGDSVSNTVTIEGYTGSVTVCVE